MKLKKVNYRNTISNCLTFIMTYMMFMNTISYATNTSSVDGILTEILQIFLGLAGFACVGKLVHIGILYMTSSAAEKSNAKTAVLPWIVGTIVCFGAGWIGPMIIEIFKVDGDVLDIN